MRGPDWRVPRWVGRKLDEVFINCGRRVVAGDQASVGFFRNTRLPRRYFVDSFKHSVQLILNRQGLPSTPVCTMPPSTSLLSDATPIVVLPHGKPIVTLKDKDTS